MIRTHDAISTAQTRTELRWLLQAAGQTALLVLGLALVVLATQSWSLSLLP